jgi:uncharacterized protein YkwD
LRALATLALLAAGIWLFVYFAPLLAPEGDPPPAPPPRPSPVQWEGDVAADFATEEGHMPLPTLPPRALGRRFRVALPGHSAENYGDEAPVTAFDHRAAEVLRRLNRRDLVYHAGLARAADTVAELHAHEDVVITGALMEALLFQAGIPFPGARRHFYFTSVPQEDKFLSYLADVLARDPPAHDRVRHVGVGYAPHAREARFAHTYVILDMTPRAALAPMPRALADGATVEVAGRLMAGLAHPKLLYLEPGGEVLDIPLATDRRGGFRARVPLPHAADLPPCPDGPVVWLEILADGARGPEVVALWPHHVGVPRPTEFTGLLPPEEGSLGAPEELAALMVELVNLDRARYGLPPLLAAPALARVALGHAEDMRDNDYVAHVAPDGRDVAARVRDAGYPTLALGENVARDDSVFSAQEALMKSLGHRENILGQRFTHVGIGVAIEERLSGGRSLSIAQKFARPAGRVAREDAANQLRGRIDRERRRAGLPPLAVSDGLQAAAARGLSRKGEVKEVTAAVQRALTERRPRMGSISIQAAVLLELDDFELPSAALDPRTEWVGLAVGQADDLIADPRIWLVLLLGEAR